MAQPRSELQAVLEGLDGVEAVYFQPPTSMVYPCIMYDRAESDVTYADNIKYLFKKRYQVIVIDRNPDSLIPDQVEALPYARFDRFYRVNGLNHTVFQLFY